MNVALPLLQMLVKKIPPPAIALGNPLSKKFTIKDLNPEFTIEAMPCFVSLGRKPTCYRDFLLRICYQNF